MKSRKPSVRALLETLESRTLLSADLRPEIGPPPNGTMFIPGETVRLPVVVHNDGGTLATGPMKISVYASADDQLNTLVDPLIATVTPSIRVLPGAVQTVYVNIPIRPDVPAGQIRCLVEVDSLNAFAESNEANNVTASPAATIAWKFGAVGRSVPVKLTLQDADGTLATFALTGKGSGEVSLVGGLWNVAFAGTDAASVVTVTVKGGDGRVDLGDITLGSLRSFSAAGANLLGNITATGSLGTLTLGDISGGHAIAIAGSVPLTFAAGRVADLQLETGGQIKLLRAAAWTKPGGLESSITATSLASLQITGNLLRGIAGDLQADLTLAGPVAFGATLGVATIVGRLGAGTWDVGGASGKITAGGIDAGFAANITGVLAGLSVKSDAAGSIAAKSITSVAVAGDLVDAQILAGADLGADAAAGGAGDSADTFGAGSIGTFTVTGEILNSTILAGIHPFDGFFNDLNDVPLTGGVIKTIRAGGIDGASRLDAATLPATATIGAIATKTAFDPRFRQNAYAITSAGVTDGGGNVTFTVNGQTHSYQFLDEATQMPLANAPASLAVDVDTFSFGVITLLAMGKRVPLQFISLSGTAEVGGAQAFGVWAGRAASFSAAADPETVSVNLATDITTKTVTDIGTPWLTKLAFDNVAEGARDAANATVGLLASAFVSLVSIGLHGLDNVTHGGTSDYLASLPFAKSEVMTASQGKADIAADRAIDLTGTVIYSTMMQKLDPLAPVATVIDLAADGVAWATCNSADRLNMGVRITTIGPIKLVSYAPISTWDRMAADGTILARVPDAASAANGFIEYISKSNPGEAFVSPLDASGNATTAVPQGDYFAIAHAPGYSATIDDLTASAGANPLDLVLPPAPVPGFVIAPATTLHTSESGGTATFAVALTTAPTANVVLTLTNSDPSETKLSKTSLTFTAANWDTPQTIVVTGVNDSAVDGNIACSIITNPATSADGNYSGVNPDDVSVVNADNEASPTPVITFDSLVIAERYEQWIGDLVWGHMEDRYRLTGTATANGPVGTYLYTYRGAINGTFVMTGWTGTLGGNHYRAAGDPASTTFTFDVYTDWLGVASDRPPFTVEVQAINWAPDPYDAATDTITITLP